MIDGQGTLSHYGAMNNSRATTRKLSADDQECSRFSKTEVVALLAICLTHIGDAIEVYLPSILTQNISCEMGLSDTHHGILSVAFYCFCAAGSFSSGWFANRMGQRKTIILSLTLSFLVSTLAALSHEFYLLLASRAATGALVGSNFALTNIYWTNVSRSARKTLGLFVASLCFSLGAGYTSVIAYFILHLVGWRLFLVISSLPLYIFPLLAFTFYLHEPDSSSHAHHGIQFQKNELEEEKSPVKDSPNEGQTQQSEQGEEMASQSPKSMIFQLSFIDCVNLAQGWGFILFVPIVYNQRNEILGANAEDCHAIFGYQFLKMTLISGIGPVATKVITFIAQMHLPLSSLMFGSSLATTISFLLLIIVDWEAATGSTAIVAVDVIMGIIKAAFVFLNLTLWLYMMEKFEGREKTTAAVIVDGWGRIGAVLGSTAVAFFSSKAVVIVMFSMGLVQSLILSRLFWKEIKRIFCQ